MLFVLRKVSNDCTLVGAGGEFPEDGDSYLALSRRPHVGQLGRFVADLSLQLYSTVSTLRLASDEQTYCRASYFSFS